MNDSLRDLPASGRLDAGGSFLEYVKYGSGPRLLYAFPGFGQHASALHGLGALLGQEYTMLSFELTRGSNSLTPPKPRKLAEALELFARSHGLDRFSFAAYSIGGRVVLTLLPLIKMKVGPVALLAPDGLKPLPVYGIATGSPVQQRAFRFLLSHADRWTWLLERLKRAGIINPSRYQFLKYYLQSPDSRRQVFEVWASLAAFRVSYSALRKMQERSPRTLHLFMGRNDAVIPLQNASYFSERVPGTELHVLEQGHRMPYGAELAGIAKLFADA